MRRGPAVLLLLSLLIGSAYGAQRALTDGWNRIHRFAPAAWQAAPPTVGPAPLADRLVLVVIDGLHQRDASLLPTLDWLRGKGAAYQVTVPSPGYQAPFTATLVTGTIAQKHGVLLPVPSRPLQGDSLPAAAIRMKVSAGGTGTSAVGRLLTSPGFLWQTSPTDELLLQQARGLLDASGPRLVLIQIDQLLRSTRLLEEESPEYKAALAALDAQLVRMFELIDLKTTAVMVIGSPEHGGQKQVPLVLAGAGVRPGVTGKAELTDLAPTAAALLGLPTPQQSVGLPVLSALAADGRPADVIVHRSLSAYRAQADAELQALGNTSTLPEPPESAAAGESYRAELTQRVRQAGAAQWKATVTERLPYLGGAILVLLLYLFAAGRQPYAAPLLLSAVVFAGMFHLLFFGDGGRYSADMAGLSDFGRPLVTALVLKTALSMVTAAALAGFLFSRRGFKKSAYLTAASLHLGLLLTALTALPILIGLVFTGWEFPVALPAPGLLVWFCLAALQVMVIGYGSPLWTLVAVTSARMSHRLWPLKEVGDPERNADNNVRLRALRRHVTTDRKG